MLLRNSALTLTLLTAACSNSKSSGLSSTNQIELGLNDVAVLIPYNKVPALMEKSPTINGDHIFVSDELLGQLSQILVGDRKIHEQESFEFGRTGDATFESDITTPFKASMPYRITSMRIDPCVNELQKSASEICEANIRLVFQPLYLENNEVFAKDSNIHAIYRIEPMPFAAVLKQMRELRAKAGPADPSEALSEHPVIAKEGEKSLYFSTLMSILKSNLSVKNLKRVAFFGDTDPNNQGHWPMVAFNVENEKPILVPLDKLSKQEGEIQKNVQRLHGNHEHLEDPLPRGDIKDTLFPIVSLTGTEDPQTIQKTISEMLKSKYQNSFLVDNPTLHDPSTVDCASCHVAQIQRSQLMPEARAMGIDLPTDLGFKSAKFNLESNVKADFSRISLQILSYFKNFPKVAPRAANDAAHSLELINKQLNP